MGVYLFVVNDMNEPKPRSSGGIIHTYQKYDPKKFPSPTEPAPDVVSAAFDHMLMYGNRRQLTEEELANAIKLDPGQFAGLGPSIDAVMEMLEDRKQRILETYETDTVQGEAYATYRNTGQNLRVPKSFKKKFRRAFDDEQIYQLEQIWYRSEREDRGFASGVLHLMEDLGNKYQIDEMAANYNFTGETSMDIPLAIEIKEELDRIEKLLEQLKEAADTAQVAVIDLQELAEFADEEKLEELARVQKQIEEYLKEVLENQGLDSSDGRVQLTPKAYAMFQGKLLERIFSDLQASKTGRHQGPVVGEGTVEMQSTKPYEFGDSVTNMDIPQTLTNAMLRSGPGLPIRLKQEDIEIHRTRNNPKCATVVAMDMSGSMRYGGEYINVKRMSLALNGLIRSEFPGDFLRFIEISTFAQMRQASELIEMMPKIPTITDPIVRLRADMSDANMSKVHIPPHFTNLQHGLQMARRNLATQDTPNRQIILITDGLPTAHFEDEHLFMLYPPDPQTEQATMREGMLCKRDGITINIFLLSTWSQTHEDVQFAHRLAESTGGRVFFTAGKELDRFVVWDYVSQRRDIIS
jgi:uncharacterized protein with von Willebrand factor type A (vWA) domain